MERTEQEAVWTADTETAAPACAAARVTLRLLSTTDLHGTLLPFDYARDRPLPGRGLATLATLIAEARAEEPVNLLCETGDMLQGSPLAELAATRALRPGEVHPVIAAMNLMGYDAAALGNHDFDHGLALVEQAARQARFPLLCANLRRPGAAPEAAAPVRATALVRRETGTGPALVVGLVGVAPPQTLRWSAAAGAALAAQGIVAAVRSHAARLRARGADLVVALCHSGIGAAGAAEATGSPGPSPAEAGAENAAAAVAREAGVDAVLAGHSHACHAIDAAPPDRADAPIVMAGAHGTHLGIIDLEMERIAGRWRTGAARVRLRAAARAAPHPAVAGASERAHRRTRRALSRPVARLSRRLHGLFPFSAEAPARRFVAAALADRARGLVAGTPLEGLPMIAAAALHECGGPAGAGSFVDLPEGTLRRRDLYRLSPFADTLAVVVLRADAVVAWLEHAAALLPQIPAGARDAPLGALSSPGYNFDVLHGLSYGIDLTRPPGKRVRDLRHRGAPVRPGTHFAVATTRFRADGGGGLAAIPPAAPRLAAELPLRDTIAAYAARADPPPCAPPVFRLHAPGATLLLRSAPQARAEDHRGAGTVTPLGIDGDGFALFRLAL